MYMCKRDDAVVRGPHVQKKGRQGEEEARREDGKRDSEGRLEQTTKPSTWGKKGCTAGQRRTWVWVGRSAQEGETGRHGREPGQSQVESVTH